VPLAPPVATQGPYMARHPGYTTSWLTLPILTASLQAKNAVSGDYQHIGVGADALVECSRLKLSCL